MNQASISSPIQACKQIILKPNHVFATLKSVENWSWIPFFLVSLFTVLPVYFYFTTIDFDWYTGLIIESQYGDVSPAEQQAFRNNMQLESLLYLTIISSIIGMVIINAIHAVYLHKITQIDEENVLSFGDWYGFTWWASLPAIITGILAIIILFLFGHEQILPTQINPLSLAFILGLNMDSSWFGLAQSVRLESIWSLYLVAVGVSQWTQLKGKQCYIIAAAPFVIVWGVWAAFILI